LENEDQREYIKKKKKSRCQRFQVQRTLSDKVKHIVVTF
jgi:hypothetical protein